MCYVIIEIKCLISEYKNWNRTELCEKEKMCANELSLDFNSYLKPHNC